MREKENKKEICAWEIEGQNVKNRDEQQESKSLFLQIKWNIMKKYWLALSNFTQFLQVQLCQSFANQFGHQRLLHRQNWA